MPADRPEKWPICICGHSHQRHAERTMPGCVSVQGGCLDLGPDLRRCLCSMYSHNGATPPAPAEDASEAKPVAWAVYHRDGTLPAHLCDNERGAESWRGGSDVYRVVPLYAIPLPAYKETCPHRYVPLLGGCRCLVCGHQIAWDATLLPAPRARERAVVKAAKTLAAFGCFRFVKGGDGKDRCGFCGARYYATSGDCKHENTCAAVALKNAVSALREYEANYRPASGQGGE